MRIRWGVPLPGPFVLTGGRRRPARVPAPEPATSPVPARSAPLTATQARDYGVLVALVALAWFLIGNPVFGTGLALAAVGLLGLWVARRGDRR
jgi:hypothetical protein